MIIMRLYFTLKNPSPKLSKLSPFYLDKGLTGKNQVSAELRKCVRSGVVMEVLIYH